MVIIESRYIGHSSYSIYYNGNVSSMGEAMNIAMGGRKMKRLTLKNFEMAMNLIMAKGYTKLQANDIAINCFALASNFGGNIEQYIQKIDEMTSAE